MRHLPGQHVLVALRARAGLVVHLPVPAEARLLRGLLDLCTDCVANEVHPSWRCIEWGVLHDVSVQLMLCTHIRVDFQRCASPPRTSLQRCARSPSAKSCSRTRRKRASPALSGTSKRSEVSRELGTQYTARVHARLPLLSSVVPMCRAENSLEMASKASRESVAEQACLEVLEVLDFGERGGPVVVDIDTQSAQE